MDIFLKKWHHVAETVQVPVPYTLSLSSRDHEENRHHFHVVPPKLEIDIFLGSLCDEFVEHVFTLRDFRDVISAPAFLEEQGR